MTGHDERLAASRRRFESRWRAAQGALRREVGVAPRRRGWLLLLFAAAAGLSLGIGGLRLGAGTRSDEPSDEPLPWELDRG